MPKTVGVAVSNATFHFDKLYTYAVMPDQQNAVKLGSMVLVPFGRGSRARMGVVLACDAEPESAKLKYLFDVAPASACLTPELLRLVHFLKERTFCTYYEAVKAVIPYGAQYKPAVAADGVTPVLQKQLTRHTENSYRLVGGLPPKPKPTAKQLAAVALLGGGPRTLNELEDKGISRAVLDNLCAKGVLECSKVNKSIDLYSSIPLKNEPITLTQEQQTAYDALLPKLEDDAPHSALLYGVTGSGKTLVFLKLIARCLEQGRRALVLVPEISLTPQMILRLKSQFGRRVAVQHSALNHTERLLQWQMIQDGGADIVVGTRSAIFSPLENIGLIIIDEEQEHTYRSESAPRYSAHEVARQRAAESGALLLLASATPSTESFYAAQHGRTQLVRLTQRYGGNPLPTVQIVDMRAELAAGNPREISLCAGRCHPPQSGCRQADHFAAEPPGLPDYGPVRGLPRGAQVHKVQRADGVPQSGAQGIVPLLRQPDGTAHCVPRLRRQAAVPGLRHPESRGRAGKAVPGCAGAAHGSGFHCRKGCPRKAAGKVCEPRI